MNQLGVKDTAAWRIVREMIDHSWGNDRDIDDEKFLELCISFYEDGGTWEDLMAGNSKCVSILQGHIDFIFHSENLQSVASRISEV